MTKRVALFKPKGVIPYAKREARKTALCGQPAALGIYGMQKIFDDLYARSKQGEHFSDLMDIVLARENILLA